MKKYLIFFPLLLFSCSQPHYAQPQASNQPQVWYIEDGVAVDADGHKLENVTVFSTESPQYIIDSYKYLLTTSLLRK